MTEIRGALPEDIAKAFRGTLDEMAFRQMDAVNARDKDFAAVQVRPAYDGKIRAQLNRFVDEGLVEIVSTSTSGVIRYRVTEKGRRVIAWLDDVE